jgi:DNA-binding CsgD family transcriptional regulator
MRPLTARHRQVLKLAALGHSNRRIGEELGIAAGTVEQHLMAIRALLGASSKREAVEFAREAGVL